MQEIMIFFENVEKAIIKLKKPEKCLPLHNLMNSCMSIDFKLRPKFVDILETLENEYKKLVIL